MTRVAYSEEITIGNASEAWARVAGSVYEAAPLVRREKTTVCLSGSKPTLR
jgi:hypothetical protein